MSKILDIHRRSGDANLGQTLLRLAGLAEAAHRYHLAAELHREDRPRTIPLESGSSVHLPHTDVGTIHREVKR